MGFRGEIRLAPELLVEILDPTTATQPPLTPAEAIGVLQERAQPRPSTAVPTVPAALSPGVSKTRERQPTNSRDNNMTPLLPAVVKPPDRGSSGEPPVLPPPAPSGSPVSPGLPGNAGEVTKDGGEAESTETTENTETKAPGATEEVLKVDANGVQVMGAFIPRQVATQIAVTAVLTTVTVMIANTAGNLISQYLSKLQRRLTSDTVGVKKNPVARLTSLFKDERPKIIIRRVHRGDLVTAMVERFDSTGYNVLLKPININNEGKISGLIDILKTQDPHFTRNLDIRIDENLRQFFHEEEVSIWEDYFTKHSKLFSGVQ